MQLSPYEQQIALGMYNVPKKCLKKKISLRDIANRIGEVRAKAGDMRGPPDPGTIQRLCVKKKVDKRKKVVEKRGRHKKLLPVTINKIPKIRDRLEKQFEDDTVAAHHIRDELIPVIERMNASGLYPQQEVPSVSTTKSYMYSLGMNAKKGRRKINLDQRMKDDRKKFATKHVKKTITKWTRKCASLDEKVFHWYGSHSQKLTVRGLGKRFT